MCRATLQTAGMLHRHLRLTHGDSRDRGYGIAALAARRQRSELVCWPRLLSDGRDNDSTSETGSSETDSDSPSLGDSDSDPNAELPPLTPPPWFVAELPELFPEEGKTPDVVCARLISIRRAALDAH